MIRAVLEFYGATRIPSGNRWAAMKCPFHGDTQASAAVNELADRFICHGCMSHSEDAVGLIMWWEGLGYREATERYESIAGTSRQPVRASAELPTGLAGLLS